MRPSQENELLPPIQHSHLNLSRPFRRLLALPLESRPYILYAKMKLTKFTFPFQDSTVRKQTFSPKNQTNPLSDIERIEIRKLLTIELYILALFDN